MKRRSIFVLVLILLPGCADRPDDEPVLAEAYVGPSQLPVRAELVARAPQIATLSHGEKIEIIGRRRRFVKIRARKNVVGWTDSRLLLSGDAMEDISTQSERAAKVPNQGEATVFEPLNVHSAPNRQAPSLFQIQVKEHVDTVTRQLAPRIPFEPPPLLPKSAIKPKGLARKAKRGPAVPLPPAGPPPPVPDDWIAMSGYPEGPPEPPAAEQTPKAPVQYEQWTLVRTKQKRAGWVLSRMLFMAIPDEVAQYAERAWITSYFNIGHVVDQGESKPIWLWTTLISRTADYDFDCLRVFTWSVRRHRYETAYIERGMKGWLPLQLTGDPQGNMSSVNLVVEEKDGSVAERQYNWTGARLRLAGRTKAERPQPWYHIEESKAGGASMIPETPPPPTSDSFKDRMGHLWQSVTHRFRK